MKKMTDKKFEEWPFQVPNFANVGARLKGFAELFAKASSPEEALKIWKKCTRLIESVEDKITHVSVLFSLETTNKKYEKAMKKINNAMPLLELETQKLSKAYLESPYLEFLEGKLGKLLTKMYQYELKKSDESVVKKPVAKKKPAINRENRRIMTLFLCFIIAIPPVRTGNTGRDYR